jgi:hypothetical protein
MIKSQLNLFFQLAGRGRSFLEREQQSFACRLKISSWVNCIALNCQNLDEEAAAYC